MTTHWEYRPGWIDDADGRARITSPATIAPGYVADYIAEGGTVVRRRVGQWEAVTTPTVQDNTTTKEDN